jgi:hypothetical protein
LEVQEDCSPECVAASATILFNSAQADAHLQCQQH